MIYLLIILLCGINIAPFIFPSLDIWHAQGIFTQACILVLFSTTFFISPKFKEPKNIELGLLHLWIGLQTAFICFISQTHQKYDITHFFPYFNFLCLIILYKIIVQYVNRENIQLCILFLKYSMVLTLIVSVLQFIGASQFFELLFPDNHSHNNPVVGLIGNGTHLSGFLAMMIPVFLYYGKREDWLCLILMGCLFFLTGTSTNNPSISGFIISSIILLMWRVKQYGMKLLLLVFCVLALSVFIVKDQHWFREFIAFSGRLELFNYYWSLIKQWFVTGAGLGTMNAIYKDSAFPAMRHLHMEYIQFILEIGIIGVVAGFAVIKKFIKIQSEDKLQLAFKLIFIGFCLSAFFNYPAHLWLPATYAVVAYSFFMVLKRDQNACIN